MPISKYTTWQQLNKTAGFSVFTTGDYIVGQSSGATGIALFIPGNGNYAGVLVLSGTFTGTEHVRNQLAVDVQLTSVGAYAGESCVLVLGDYSAYTDIIHQIKLANDSGSWGLFSYPNEYTSKIGATIIFGHAGQTAATTIYTQDERASIDDNIFFFGAVSYLTTFKAGAGTYSGKVSKGSQISYGKAIYYNPYISWTILDSEITNLSSGSGMDGLDSSVPVIDIDETVFNEGYGYGFNFHSDNTRLRRTNFQHSPDGGFMLTSGSITFEEVVVQECSYNFFGIGLFTGRMRNCILRNAIVSDFGGFFLEMVAEMVDSYFYTNPVDGGIWITTFWGGIMVKEMYSFNFKSITANNIPIEGVSIKVWNSVDTDPIIDLVTDANGEIEEQLVTNRMWYKTDNWNPGDPNFGATYVLPTNYAPFKIVITKEGWAEQIFFDTITSSKNYVITLKNKNPEAVGTGQ